MNTNTMIVVADKFVEFTADKKAVTLSQLKAMLELPQHILPGPVRLLCGQGLSDADISEIITRIDTLTNSEARWDTKHLRACPARALSALSHKREACNTLISTPEQIGDDTFRIDLCIDENCELMGDHQTGQHVQGMILVEAARQSFLAVTEKFYPMENVEKTYFVINEMTTAFLGFMFPLGAQIEYRIKSKDINERRQKFCVEMDFVQNTEKKMTAEYAFTVYPDQTISRKEADLAQSATEYFFAATSAPIGTDQSQQVA